MDIQMGSRDEIYHSPSWLCFLQLLLSSESEGSSSYGGESEDSDWAPPPVAPPTGAAADDDDDDIDELLSEAKHFIANKNMRKH